MSFLLDTHTFLWIFQAPERLPKKVRKIITDSDNTLFLSTASGWEIGIKYHLGKLKLPQRPDDFVPVNTRDRNILSLEIEMEQALRAASLPAYHKDPFDRMLIAQAQLKKLTVLTGAAQFNRYDVSVFWS